MGSYIQKTRQFYTLLVVFLTGNGVVCKVCFMLSFTITESIKELSS